MEIELNVKISEEDHIKINKETNKIEAKFRLFIIRVSGVIFLICSLFLILNDLLNKRFLENWFLNTFMILFNFFVFWVVPKFWIYNYKKLYRSNKNSSETIKYLINEDFISFKTNFSESKTSWQTISKMIELKEWILLKYSNLNYYTLPKNQLSKSEREWLKQKVENKK